MLFHTAAVGERASPCVSYRVAVVSTLPSGSPSDQRGAAGVLNQVVFLHFRKLQFVEREGGSAWHKDQSLTL